MLDFGCQSYDHWRSTVFIYFFFQADIFLIDISHCKQEYGNIYIYNLSIFVLFSIAEFSET